MCQVLNAQTYPQCNTEEKLIALNEQLAKVPQTDRSDSNYASATEYVATELKKKRNVKAAKETKKRK